MTEEKEKVKKKQKVKDTEFLMDQLHAVRFELQQKTKALEAKELACDKLKNRLYVEGNKTVTLHLVHEAALACSYSAIGDLESLKSMLVTGGDILKANYDFQTPLHAAALCKQRHCVDFLLSSGARALQKDVFGRTPLDMALFSGDAESASMIEEAASRQEKDYFYKIGDWNSTLLKIRFKKIDPDPAVVSDDTKSPLLPPSIVTPIKSPSASNLPMPYSHYPSSNPHLHTSNLSTPLTQHQHASSPHFSTLPPETKSTTPTDSRTSTSSSDTKSTTTESKSITTDPKPPSTPADPKTTPSFTTSTPGPILSSTTPGSVPNTAIPPPMNQTLNEDDLTKNRFRRSTSQTRFAQRSKVSSVTSGLKKLARPLSQIRTSLFKREIRRYAGEEDEEEDEADYVERDTAVKKEFGVVYGTKRGECLVPLCGCHYFRELQGRPSCKCGHFPASHQYLGVASLESKKYSILDGLELLNIENATVTSVLVSKSIDLEWPKVLNYNTVDQSEYLMEVQNDIKNEKPQWVIPAEDLEFLGEIGKGTTAIVYSAKYKDETVAVKIIDFTIPPRNKERNQLVQDIKLEFDVMCSLTSSENMVKLYGVVIEPRICMILEYCGGGSLYSILNTEDFDFELDQFFLWIKQIVEGIKYLHKNSIVHRDLKSLNLLLTDDLHIKVADFGLSRFFTQNSHLSTLQKLRGTYCYTAPEIYFHQTYTTKSDFYSLGIIIWEMSMRYFFKKYFRPYSEYTYLTMDCQIIIKCAKEELRPTIPEKFPKRLRGFIKYLWAQSPDFRPNGEQLSTALNELEKSSEKHYEKWHEEGTTPEVVDKPKPSPRNNKIIITNSPNHNSARINTYPLGAGTSPQTSLKVRRTTPPSNAKAITRTISSNQIQSTPSSPIEDHSSPSFHLKVDDQSKPSKTVRKPRRISLVSTPISEDEGVDHSLVKVKINEDTPYKRKKLKTRSLSLTATHPGSKDSGIGLSSPLPSKTELPTEVSNKELPPKESSREVQNTKPKEVFQTSKHTKLDVTYRTTPTKKAPKKYTLKAKEDN